MSVSRFAFAALAGGAALAMAGSAGAQSNPSTSMLVGTWKSPTKNATIAIAPCGQSLCGRLQDSDDLRADPDRRDIKNKDHALRDRKLAGMLMLQGFTGGPDKWTGGTVYNGDDGGTYKGTITRVDNDRIKLTGCIIYPLCKTEFWTRVAAAPAG